MLLFQQLFPDHDSQVHQGFHLVLIQTRLYVLNAVQKNHLELDVLRDDNAVLDIVI